MSQWGFFRQKYNPPPKNRMYRSATRLVTQFFFRFGDTLLTTPRAPMSPCFLTSAMSSLRSSLPCQEQTHCPNSPVFGQTVYPNSSRNWQFQTASGAALERTYMVGLFSLDSARKGWISGIIPVSITNIRQPPVLYTPSHLLLPSFQRVK